MIDSHCHLNFNSFDEDRAQVLERATGAGVYAIINPAVDLNSCEEVLALARRWPQVYAAVGVHPNSCGDFGPESLSALRALSKRSGVVAIGEIGLDYYRERCSPGQQHRALRQQLQLAAECDLPVIIHNREASADLLPILEAQAGALPAEQAERIGVLHSFSASAEVARKALALGFYLGFTGPITFRKAEALRNVAREVPLERLLVETDAPFLSPEPFRGRRNEPARLPHIIEQLAALHGVSPEVMRRITSENTRRLFRLPN